MPSVTPRPSVGTEVVVLPQAVDQAKGEGGYQPIVTYRSRMACAARRVLVEDGETSGAEDLSAARLRMGAHEY